MQFGFGAPISGPLSLPNNLARIAVEGEAMGYDYATISDHVVIPRDIEAKYPYSDTGEFPGRAGGDRHEQLIAVAFIAGKTSRLRLVTSVTVIPHRPAVLQAKMLATIDVLSKGRLTSKNGVAIISPATVGGMAAPGSRLSAVEGRLGARPTTGMPILGSQPITVTAGTCSAPPTVPRRRTRLSPNVSWVADIDGCK